MIENELSNLVNDREQQSDAAVAPLVVGLNVFARISPHVVENVAKAAQMTMQVHFWTHGTPIGSLSF